MTDTSSEVLLRYRRRLLALSPEARVAMTSRMFSTAKTLAVAGLLRDGERPDREQLFRRLYGHDFDPCEVRRIAEYLRTV
jgi:hypothetical protein